MRRSVTVASPQKHPPHFLCFISRFFPDFSVILQRVKTVAGLRPMVAPVPQSFAFLLQEAEICPVRQR